MITYGLHYWSRREGNLEDEAFLIGMHLHEFTIVLRKQSLEAYHWSVMDGGHTKAPKMEAIRRWKRANE